MEQHIQWIISTILVLVFVIMCLIVWIVSIQQQQNFLEQLYWVNDKRLSGTFDLACGTSKRFEEFAIEVAKTIKANEDKET